MPILARHIVGKRIDIEYHNIARCKSLPIRDIIAARMIQMGQVASIFTIFSHHANRTVDLVHALTNSVVSASGGTHHCCFTGTLSTCKRRSNLTTHQQLNQLLWQLGVRILVLDITIVVKYRLVPGTADREAWLLG